MSLLPRRAESAYHLRLLFVLLLQLETRDGGLQAFTRRVLDVPHFHLQPLSDGGRIPWSPVLDSMPFG